MAIAGIDTLVKVHTSSDPSGGTGFNNVDGINSISVGDSTTLLDMTDFADDDIMRRLKGLRDVTITLSGDWEGGDVNGQTVLRTAYAAGSVVYVHFLPTGAYAGGGFEYRCLVADMSIDASTPDKVTVSFTLNINDDGTGTAIQALTT